MFCSTHVLCRSRLSIQHGKANAQLSPQKQTQNLKDSRPGWQSASSASRTETTGKTFCKEIRKESAEVGATTQSLKALPLVPLPSLAENATATRASFTQSRNRYPLLRCRYFCYKGLLKCYPELFVSFSNECQQKLRPNFTLHTNQRIYCEKRRQNHTAKT